MGKAIKKALGFSKPKAPKVPERREEEEDETAIDPNRGRALAQAKRRRAQNAKRRGRASFRIDLAVPTPSEQNPGSIAGLNVGRS